LTDAVFAAPVQRCHRIAGTFAAGAGFVDAIDRHPAATRSGQKKGPTEPPEDNFRSRQSWQRRSFAMVS